MNPKFSVILPLYNKENYIGDTLKSVLEQTETDFEIIIVNDGSTDSSKQIINSFTDRRIKYFSKDNGGASSARNFGMEKASGEFIAFLDADDYWYPHHLKKMAKLITLNPNYQVFASATNVETEKNTYPSQYSIKNFKNTETYILNYFNASLQASILNSSNIVIKKEVVKNIGLFDTKYRSGEDTDYWIRIGLNYPVVFSGKISVRYKYVETSLSNSSKNLSEKPTFEIYRELEKENPELKKFLDVNRFSLAILAKLTNDREGFVANFNRIDLNSLTKKQRLLLKLPPKSTSFLYRLKNFADRFGIKLSAFR
ncbi:MAG: glycosyltransferase family 2 protein [Flavobacteriales bacterium]|jgi:glycosyltransferase involved in cell wall biosynthesis|nr:glycosyltransferase family 2 protein [Flavobacteriales bacterium]